MPEVARLINGLDRDGIRPIVVASHPRCGTHLLIDTLRLNFPETRGWKFPGERLDRLYLNVDSLTRLENPLPWAQVNRILRRAQRPILKTHALPDFGTFYLEKQHAQLRREFIDWLLRRADFLYVYRDLRGAMCSLHEFVAAYDPAARVPLGEFIRQREGDASRVNAWARHVRAWTDVTRVYCVKMEEILRSPQQTLHGMAERLGLSLPPNGQPLGLPSRLQTIWHSRLARLLSMRPRSTAILPPSGIEHRVDPRTAFSAEDLRFIQQETGDLLFQLGYDEFDYGMSDARGSGGNVATSEGDTTFFRYAGPVRPPVLCDTLPRTNGMPRRG